MEDQRFRFFLNEIADQLRSEDVEKMRYLCSEKIEAGILSNLSARDLFVVLQNRTIIDSSNFRFLIELLNNCDRQDLVRKTKSYRGDDLVTESGVTQTEVSATLGSSQFKHFLAQLGDELTRKDIDAVKFLISIPGGMAHEINTGLKILDYLLKSGQIGQSDMSLLEEIFTAIHRKDLTMRVQKYCGSHSTQRTGSVTPVITSNKPSTRQPSTHSEPFSANPRPTLLSPDHFRIAQPAYVRPTAPVESPDEEDMHIESYSMNRRPRGICLIFNNKTFRGPIDLPERAGTEKDVENLQILWEKLHFNVVIKQDLTAHEMYDAVRDYSRLDHSNYDCFVCCILSHGVQGGIYGADGDVIEMGQITSQFKGTACRSLANKPKLFFVQACRGKDFDVGVQPDAVRNSDEEAMRHSAEPNEGHFLLGYATPPGYVSWRSTEHGSWYISHLCTVFSTFCERYDVMDMMIKVNDRVSDAFTKKGYKQCPAPVVTLRKKIYFKNN